VGMKVINSQGKCWGKVVTVGLLEALVNVVWPRPFFVAFFVLAHINASILSEKLKSIKLTLLTSVGSFCLIILLSRSYSRFNCLIFFIIIEAHFTG